jgi:hypothetical protein
MDGWMDFGGWSPVRLLHTGLNSGLMRKPERENNRIRMLNGNINRKKDKLI